MEVIVESATRCISAINPQIKVPSRLPSGVSQRIDIAAQVASLCKVNLVIIVIFNFINAEALSF